MEFRMLLGLQADWLFSAPCSAEEEQTCWCWFWEIVKQTAVGVGSQGSLIQVDYFQFLGCPMGAAGTLEPWHGSVTGCLGVHLGLIHWRRSRLSNQPKMGPTLRLKPMAWCKMLLLSLSPTNFVADFCNKKNLITRHDEAMIMEKLDQLWTSMSVL